MTELREEILQLKEMVKHLTMLVMKDKVDTTWLSEEQAAEALGLEARTLRRKVKSMQFPFNQIDFRHTNGRNFQYNRKGLLKFKEITSTMA